MGEDTKQLITATTAIVLLGITLALSCVRCEKQRVQLGTDCIRAGHAAIECKFLMGEK